RMVSTHYILLPLIYRLTFFFLFFFFFFNDTAPTEIYTLSLHDALPIYSIHGPGSVCHQAHSDTEMGIRAHRDAAGIAMSTNAHLDRKSTRLNSSHVEISYAVFCLKKKKKKKK